MKRFEHKSLGSGTLGVAEVINSDVDASDVTQAAEPLLIVRKAVKRFVRNYDLHSSSQ